MRLLTLVTIIALSFSFSVQASDQTSTAAPATIKLFNGKDLTGWYVYTEQTKYENPGIFTVVDGMLKVSGGVEGQAYLGGLITKEEYENYRLVVEYKWGGPTWGVRKGKSRDSGVLVHCIGPDGPGPWKASIECQVIEGGTGDFILVGGLGSDGKPFEHSITAEVQKRGGQYYFHPGGAKVTVNTGRINWYGRDPNWKDVIDFRGANDVESPFGEWTRIECICDGATLTNYINGKLVNRITHSKLTKGKILLQTEGAEVWYRKVELTPLAKNRASARS